MEKNNKSLTGVQMLTFHIQENKNKMLTSLILKETNYVYMQKCIDIIGLQTADTGGNPRYMHNAAICSLSQRLYIHINISST